MSAQPDFLETEAQPWEDKLRADENLLRARAWNADLLGAFRAARSYYAREYGKQLRAAYGSEWLKVVTQAFEVYAALIDAGEDDDDDERRQSNVRRFPLAAWKAQTYLSRKALPYLPAEDFAKAQAALRRGWSRYGWRWVHLLQRVTHDALFECESLEFKDNPEGRPTFYTDHFNDLLMATIKAARKGRRTRRVNNMEDAFAECLRSARQDLRVPVYAEKWEPPKPVDAEELHRAACLRLCRGSLGLFCLAVVAVEEARRPQLLALEVVRRAVRRARSIVGDDAALLGTLQVEAHALVDELFEREEVTPSAGSPCDEDADSPQTVEFAQESANSPGDFGGKMEDSEADRRTLLSYGAPALEVVEYEPEDEPRGVSLGEAEAAAALCASVGVERVKRVLVDDTKPDGDPERITLARDHTLAEFQGQLPYYLERNRRSSVESMTVRIRFKGDFRLLQLDDTPPAVLEVLRPFAFFMPATSPGNGQAWLAFAEDLSEAQYDELRYRLFKTGPLAKLGVNGGAHGSVRWPGSLNKKPSRRYADGEPPRVQLLYAAVGRTVTVAELESAGLLGEAPPKQKAVDVRAIRGKLPKGWPDLTELYAKYDDDRSRAEYVWCLKALQKGWPAAHVERELSVVRSKATVRSRDSYVSDTVRKAASWLELNPPSSARAESFVEVEL
jgi:hypothetical protein